MSGLLGLVILVLDVIAIINVLKSGAATGKKVLWVLLIVLIPVIGMILYFILGNKKAA